jgi:Flp pilus assembly secretin CpaC
VRESKSQVPFLGSIPIIGELFKTRSVDKVKTNLMVFIRPRILRDGTDAAIESNAKYNYIREQQTGRNGGRVPLMPSERQPTLPPLEQLVPSELLNPARQASPQGATPAERLQGSSSQEYYLPSDPTTGITHPAPATAPTAPFGETTPPPAPAPGTTP